MSDKRATTDQAAAFSHVREWVFDLDNTLYPAGCDLFSQVDRRMTAYIGELLSLSPEDAYRLQKDLYREHGTTLRGLIERYGIDPQAFLSYVHDIDYAPVEANPALSEALLALPGRRLIHTNGDRPHALRVADRLGIADHFDEIFDIVDSDFVPKPQPEPYSAFIARHGVDPKRAAMFEDMPRNLQVPKRLGMVTVLIKPEAQMPAFRQAWEDEGDDGDHIDAVISDLAAFLRAVNPKASAA